MSETRLPGRHLDSALALTLVPYGLVDHAELKDLARALLAKEMKVRIGGQRPIPQEAFNSRRQQYRADDFLEVARSEPGDRVLVVTNYDLYADNLNFVFGLAASPGTCAVISLFRLRIGADEETFRQRAVKEAVHELGHTFGLSHCADSRCVMYFSNSLEDTDRKGNEWCERCKSKFRRYREHAALSQEQGG